MKKCIKEKGKQNKVVDDRRAKKEQRTRERKERQGIG
jgi:hypothetical protein